MTASRRLVLGTLVLGGLSFAVTGALGQSGSNPPGIDVSHWQGAINWTSVKSSGIVFAFCKATEGTTYVDPQFATNWAAMKSKGIVRGAYHFGRPGSNAVKQAQLFVNTVKPQGGDLPLVLDIETTDGMTPAQEWAWIQAFCGEVKRLTHKPCIIYTGYYNWRDDVGNPTNTLGCPLWMARWSSVPTPLPGGWSTWTFWQYSSTGTTAGISGNVDQDYYNGSLADLQNLTYPRDPLNRK